MYQPSTTSYPLPTPATRWWRLLALLLGLSLLLSSLPLVLPISLPPAAPAPAVPAPAPEMARLPLSFVPNAGQSHPDVRFQARGLGGTIFFTPEAVVLTLPPPAAPAAPAETLRVALSPYVPAAPAAPTVVRLQFSGANPAPEVRSGEALPGTVNYFIGSDPAQWQTNLSTYAGVVYADLYDGIDLVYDGTRGTLKGTYTVAPGSDPARIGWRYAGAEDVRVDAASGNLHIRVAEGHTLTEHAPIAWQTIDGERVPVAARYTLAADGRIGFALGAYDDTHPLIIDPTLEYSTYLGGGDGESGNDIAVDSVGNVYIVGTTTSTDFPTFSAYQDTYGGGTDDVLITKLSSDGSSLLFSTFLGGSASDEGYAIALDDAGNAYITGSTDSTNFPTVNAYQDTHGGGAEDAFITKLSSDGSSLLFSTFLGGNYHNHYDAGHAIAVDDAGNVAVTGITEDADFPTVNAYQDTYGGGTYDAFIAKLSSDGSSLLFSTYLGGGDDTQDNSTGKDEGQGIAIDSTGNIYVTGSTHSVDFPTVNAYQSGYSYAPSFDGSDVFIAKLSSDGSVRFSTYLGGWDFDSADDIALDSAGNVYVIGYTGSDNFPTTANAYQKTHSRSDSAELFITKLSSDGSSLLFSTYLGGAEHDFGESIALDSLGNVYVTGYTISSDFPTVNAYQDTFGGLTDAFVAKLSSDGSSLLFSTYLGGADSDEGYGIAVDSIGNAYVAGYTKSTDFPLVSPYQGTLSGGNDAFIAKFATDTPILPTVQFESASYSVSEIAGSATITVTLSNSTVQPVSVDCITSNGSATAGSDYAASFSVLEIPPGETSTTFTVPIYSDNMFEGDETVNVTLSSPTNATLGTPINATLTISDPPPEPGTPTVQFSSASYSAREGDSSATITVTLSAATTKIVSVNYATSDGSATAGSDYAESSWLLDILPGETSATFNVPIYSDSIFEGDETVNLTLSTPTNAPLGTPPSATLTISDAQPDPGAPTVQFSSASYSAREGDQAIIVAMLSTPASQEITAEYETVGISAHDGTDYDAAAQRGTLTFPAGSTSQNLALPIASDSRAEGAEIVALRLHSVTGGATLGAQSAATLAIVDTTPSLAPAGVLAFATTEAQATEGDTASVIVQRTAGSSGSVTVRYRLLNGTARSDSDYLRANGVLTFGDGVTSQAILVTLPDDSTAEGDEYLTLSLSDATGGATIGTQGTARLTIRDNDSAPASIVQVAQPVVRANEDGPNALIIIQRTGNLDSSVSVGYDTFDGNAHAGSDYTRQRGTLTFAAGQTQQIIAVPIIDDTLVEGDEHVWLALHTASGGTLADNQRKTRLIILDDEVTTSVGGSVQFAAPQFVAHEDGRSATITVERVGDSSVPVMMRYATLPGTAQAGTDYTTTQGTLSFGAGETVRRFSVALVDDADAEGTESISLLLSQVTGGARLGALHRADLRIDDDETAANADNSGAGILQFAAASHFVVEEQGQVLLVVERLGGSSGSVSVSYDVRDESAQMGEDYIPIRGTLTFADGVTRQTIPLAILDDADTEGNETFALLLEDATGDSTLGSQHTLRLTIIDNDLPAAGVLQFAAPISLLPENGGAAYVVVERLGGSAGSVRVDYATSDSSATPGSDYAAMSDSLTFAEGESTQTFTIPITDDATLEAEEDMTLTLHNPVNTVLGTGSSATVVIVDNDSAADNLEPNNTCPTARQIPTDGTIQSLTFDQPNDTDWMLFDTVAGERYRIIATTPTGSPANVRLELHQACQDTPEQEQNQTFSPGVRLTFDAPQSAAYRLKTTNDPPNVGGAEFAYTIQIERVQPAAPTGALILIAGKLKANDPLQPNIHHVTNQIYQLFQSWGYTHEQINYLATDQTLDADGDGSADVDAAVTTEALEEAITSWAPSKVGPDRPLTIYIVDHGEHDLVYLDGTQQELATPAQIDDWLAKLERQQPDVASRIIIESCYSGSFINLVEKVSKVGRIIITSTDDQNDAYASENGVVFSDHFISALAQGQDFSSSFQMAHDATSTANTDQTPWIDANGNGIPNEEADYIPGTHTVVQPTEERWPPYIKDVTLVDTVQNERGQIQASIEDDQAVQQVWAEIYAPSYTPPPSSSELVRPTVPSIVLNKQTGTQYQGVYDSFDEAGTYRVVLHAIDNEDLRAQPVELQITVRQQRTTLYLPLVQR